MGEGGGRTAAPPAPMPYEHFFCDRMYYRAPLRANRLACCRPALRSRQLNNNLWRERLDLGLVDDGSVNFPVRCLTFVYREMNPRYVYPACLSFL